MLLYFAIFRLDGSGSRMHLKMKVIFIKSVSRMMQLCEYLQKEHLTKFKRLT